MTTDYEKIADKFAAHSDTMAGNLHYERPATMALLPPLEGLDVLDAGCGSGFYTEYAHKAGARVVAFDPSGKMVKHAVKRMGDACEIHHCTSSELIEILDGRRFDLILSNLVMHYVVDLDLEFANLSTMLKPGGRIIVSMKHPMSQFDIIQKFGYRTKKKVIMKWDVGRVVHIQRPLGDITSAIHKAGLIIERLDEPYPEPEMETQDPEGYKLAQYLPFFITFVLRKPN